MPPETTATPTPARASEMLIVTGMSGAGRATCARMLEDLGWFVVDNLPPQMIVPLFTLTAKGGENMPRVAVVIDVRGGEHFSGLRDAIDAATSAGLHVRVLFLDASNEALVRRFESVRRPHPLQGEGRILDGITSERATLQELRGRSDLIVDTSDYNVHQLSARISELFAESSQAELRLHVMSFGFKYGLPVDADHVVDVRFLPNPYWVPELKGHNGTEAIVSDYVMSQPGARDFVERYTAALEPVVDGYLRERRGFVTVAVGCTGGKHRSVATSIELAAALRREGISVRISHRDLGRE